MIPNPIEIGKFVLEKTGDGGSTWVWTSSAPLPTCVMSLTTLVLELDGSTGWAITWTGCYLDQRGLDILAEQSGFGDKQENGASLRVFPIRIHQGVSLGEEPRGNKHLANWAKFLFSNEWPSTATFAYPCCAYADKMPRCKVCGTKSQTEIV
jgi:hypothetical protein